MSSWRSPTKLRKRRILNCARKVGHPTYHDAEQAMIEVAALGRLYGQETSVYECGLCGMFHWASHAPVSELTKA